MEESVFEVGMPVGMQGRTDASDFLPAIVSIDIQKFGEVYDTETGFDCGTIFPALNKPWLAGGMRK